MTAERFRCFFFRRYGLIWIPLDWAEFCQVRRDPNYTISFLSNGMTSCQFRKMFSTLIIAIICPANGIIGIVYSGICNRFARLIITSFLCKILIIECRMRSPSVFSANKAGNQRITRIGPHCIQKCDWH